MLVGFTIAGYAMLGVVSFFANRFHRQRNRALKRADQLEYDIITQAANLLEGVHAALASSARLRGLQISITPPAYKTPGRKTIEPLLVQGELCITQGTEQVLRVNILWKVRYERELHLACGNQFARQYSVSRIFALIEDAKLHLDNYPLLSVGSETEEAFA